MSRRVMWLLFVVIFLAGLSVGFLVSLLGLDLGLPALYERLGGWTLLGRAAVALLILAIPVGYIVWLIAGAVQFATSVDRAQAEAPLHFIQRGERSSIRRVLVSTRGGGPHAWFGLRLATRIARAGDGEVTLFRVLPVSEEADPEGAEEALHALSETVVAADVPVHARVVQSPSVVDAILEETVRGEYDLLIVGASDEGTVQRLLFGTVVDAVAGRTPCPVLIVRGTAA
ncbi:MAG: universal stress protein [Chloroflexota bacterium]